MNTSAFQSSSITRLAKEARTRLGWVLVMAAVCAVLGAFATVDLLQNMFLAAAAALSLFFVSLVSVNFFCDRRTKSTLDVLRSLIEQDATATCITDDEGTVRALNLAAGSRFDLIDTQGRSMSSVLENTLANPSAIVFRLLSSVAEHGAAQEDFVTRGGHVRVNVHKVSRNSLIWRVEDVPAIATHYEGPVLPMILTSRANTVLYMNDAARDLVGGKLTALDRIFTTPIVSGAVCDIATPGGPRSFLVHEMDAGAGRCALFLLPPTLQVDVENRWNTFNNLPVPLLKVSPEGNVQAFNTMAGNLIGPSLVNDAHLSEIMEGLGRPITDWLNETLARRASQQSEFLRLKRADKEIFVQVTLNHILENGSPFLIAVLNDATELKSLEAQFVQSQKMQAIGQLAGGVAHDFNNLLTSISGHCDLLLLRHDQGDPDFGDLVQINQNANRAAALVGQLLAFSRKQTLRPETLDIRDTLSDMTHLLNRLVGEKVTLSLTNDPVLKPIRADKRQLEQVLMNLVVNARDAMPRGGEIRINTECIRLDEPYSRDRVTVPVGEYLTVKVSDDGSGIPSDKLQKVFEPFFTTKRTGEGTGLGLSTAYGIVKQTGGYIFVDSAVGHGTCFTLYFPVLEREEKTEKAKKDKAKKPFSKHGDGVILLVEDEAPVRAFASRALRLRGYTVLEADSAEAALKTLEDASLNVDVFVTDVVMPGMDGPSWVRKALETRPDVRVVFVSGYAEDSFGEAQMKIPNSVFLPKPFSLNDLTETVQKQLH